MITHREYEVSCGTLYDYANKENCKDLTAFEDDHGVYIKLSETQSIRIEPQEFPALIALMATTMDGMVEF